MKVFIAVATAALALLALSCGEEEGPTGPAPYPALDSPDHVLTNVEMSFHRRDDARLRAALDEDAFVFYFNPQDVGERVGNYIIPESWAYAEFYHTCGNMFDDAYTISLEIQPIGKPPADATEYTAFNVAINLLCMTDEQNGFRADKGYCNFRFRKDTDARWRLVKWWDYTMSFDESGRAEPTSFGRVLALYY